MTLPHNEVQSFRGADCDNAEYLVTGKVMERISACKRAKQKIDIERLFSI
jgi:hypothetical protein